jgi:hypothetical protein
MKYIKQVNKTALSLISWEERTIWALTPYDAIYMLKIYAMKTFTVSSRTTHVRFIVTTAQAKPSVIIATRNLLAHQLVLWG